MAVLCLLTMADRLAARVTHGPRKHKYNHTGGACKTQKEAVRTERPRLRARTNFCRPSKAAGSTLVELVSSVHKCGSSGTVTHVQTADEVCVVKGPNGPGGFE